jgi:hypothetical protein
MLSALLSEIRFAIKLFNTYQPVIGKVTKVLEINCPVAV